MPFSSADVEAARVQVLKAIAKGMGGPPVAAKGPTLPKPHRTPQTPQRASQGQDGPVFDMRLPFVPTLNTYWRHVGHKVLISKAGRQYRQRMLAIIPPGIRMQGRLAVRIDVFPPDRRRRDLSNIPKALEDAMTHAGVWADDEQIDDLQIVRGGITPGGGVRVRIWNIT